MRTLNQRNVLRKAFVEFFDSFTEYKFFVQLTLKTFDTPHILGEFSEYSYLSIVKWQKQNLKAVCNIVPGPPVLTAARTMCSTF